jgi:hypothetical protein
MQEARPAALNCQAGSWLGVGQAAIANVTVKAIQA